MYNTKVAKQQHSIII